MALVYKDSGTAAVNLSERATLLRKHEGVCQLRPVRGCWIGIFLLLPALSGMALAQTKADGPYYARSNSFGVFVADSGDSSHMLLGSAEQRKLFDVGFSYNRRFFLRRIVSWQYSAELLPVALESDPLARFVVNETSPTIATFTGDLADAPVSCAPVTVSFSNVVNGVTYAGTETYSCHGRQWTIGEAMSPVGMQWNFLPLRRIQPFINGHGGYMYSTRPIPIGGAGSFNFTFDVGAGIEFYRTRTQSLRLEYRYHHISNGDTANSNPGVDSGVFQVTYAFGR